MLIRRCLLSVQDYKNSGSNNSAKRSLTISEQLIGLIF